MPVLVCSYCGKTYKVSQSRYDKAMDGRTKHPSCSLRCKGRIMSLTADEQRTDVIELKGLGIKEMLESQNKRGSENV